MKTNTKKKGNPAKKLIPAAGSLMVSAVMLATSTYAWFTMNKEVTVTGMQMKTKVGSNLLVCDTNREADYKDDLIQTRKVLLEPTSTINASDGSFFYTVNAAADGHWLAGSGTMKAYNESSGTTISDTNAAKTKYDSTFNSTYGNTNAGTATAFSTAYGYVDYEIFLKATSDVDNSVINLTECNLLYNNAVPGSGDYAWRVAIFAKKINEEGDGTINQDITSDDSNLVSILRIKGNSVNWTSGAAVSSNTGATSSVTKADVPVSFGDVDTGASQYYKVVARVWLEGEDKSCNADTYAALMDKIWELGLQFELGQGTAVDTIASSIDNDTGAIMKTSGT